jgi:predicted outer membrane protein
MRRGIVRSAVAALLAVLVVAWPAAGVVFADQPAAPAAAGVLQPLEREFITVIRFANLWEIPMGQLAVQRGTTQTVKNVGATLAADHTKLDVEVKKLAARFGVPLPNQPTSSQQSWIADISGKTGREFDRTFADRLRAAHGTVFGLVAEVRAGTRNEVIRSFAQTANEIVMKHMTLLESTGLVEPMAMFAEASARTVANPENRLGRREIILALVLGVTALAGTLLAIRTLSSGAPGEMRTIMKG